MSKKSKSYDYETDQPYEDHAAGTPEPSPEERIKDLLRSMTEAQRHNAPVTPLMLSEVSALISHITGQPVAKPLHHILDTRGHPGGFTIRKPDGTLEAIDTVEEALVYVRSLPVDVQKRPYWVKADKALAEAVTYVEGGDTSPAMRLFDDALTQDRALEPPKQVDIPPRDASLEPKPQPAAEPEPAHG
jgi:hypothetical protein